MGCNSGVDRLTKPSLPPAYSPISTVLIQPVLGYAPTGNSPTMLGDRCERIQLAALILTPRRFARGATRS